MQSLEPGGILPYTTFDLNQDKKKLWVSIDNSDAIINMDKALKKKIIKGESGQHYCLQLTISSHGRKLKISPSESPHVLKKQEMNRAKYLQTLLKRRFNGIFSLNLKMKGLGISIIDEQPKELFFFTVYNMDLVLKKTLEARKDIGVDILEYLTSMKLCFEHIQIDSMQSKKMPVIMAPVQPLRKREFKVAEAYVSSDIEEEKTSSEMPNEMRRTTLRGSSEEEETEKEQEDVTPFFQAMIGYSQGIPEKGMFTQKEERISSVQFSL